MVEVIAGQRDLSSELPPGWPGHLSRFWLPLGSRPHRGSFLFRHHWGGGGRRRGAGGCPGSAPCLPGPAAGLARLGPLVSRGAHALQATPAFLGPRKHFCSQGCNLRKPGMSLFADSPSQASTQTPAPPSIHTLCTCCRCVDVPRQELSGTQTPVCTHRYKVHAHSSTQLPHFLHVWLSADVFISTSFPTDTRSQLRSILGKEFLVCPWPITGKPFASANATRRARDLSLHW